MRKNYGGLAVLLLLILSASLTICLFLLLTPIFSNDEKYSEEYIQSLEDNGSDSDVPNVLLNKIDFQPIVDEWVSSTEGDKGIYIYDLDLGEEVGRYNSNKEFQTASIYKLFVVYEGYKRLESGEWEPDDMAGATGHTISKCLDLAIRESNSECAETIWEKIGIERMQDIINNIFHLKNTELEDLTSTPKDVAEMIKIFYHHEDINSAEYLAQLKDSFLNQPATIHDWRQGLPSGFETAKVYNKVGWDYDDRMGRWNIYNDAAIVEFPEQNRHYVVVVMTNNVQHQQIRKLGQMLEEKFFSMY